MSALNDLGTSTVAEIDKTTGYPKDEYGRLLSTISYHTGAVEKDWDKKGTKLLNLTSPYGFLEMAVGSGDDFWCFDYATINAGPRGRFIILDATINSETGSFIMSGDYQVLPINTDEEKKAAVEAALYLVGQAVDWTFENDVRHTRKGWNQCPEYFAHAVARNLFKYKFEKASEREIRMGSKRVNKIMKELLGW